MMRKCVAVITAAAVLAALNGCATIVGSPTQLMPISSTPSDAAIVITDEKGTEVFKGSTPTTVTLAKSNGGFWNKKTYSVAITKPGFQSQMIPVTASPNGWYLFGNIAFGGLIGWLIVDPQGGHMYTLSPDQVSATLPAQATSHNNTGRDGAISVVLLEDVPPALREKMQPLR